MLKHRRGVTLMEVSTTLVVLAIILGVVMILVSYAHDMSKNNGTKEELNTIFDSISHLYDIGDTSPPAQAIMQYSELGKRYISGSEIVDYDGNPITFSDTGGYYTATMTNVNKSLCYALSTWINLGGAVTSLKINNTTYVPGTYTCASSNTLAFIFYSVTTKSSSSSSEGTGSNDTTTPTTPALTPIENDLAKLMKAQMDNASAARALYAASVQAANQYQAAAQTAASQGQYDAMNQDYQNMNKELDQKNKALDQWNVALDYGNRINAATQGIYAQSGQNQKETMQQYDTAAASVNYVNPIPNGID